MNTVSDYERDLENAGATILEPRDDGRVGDYSIQFDGSFEELDSMTEYRYESEARTYENENGRRYIVSVPE